MQNQAAWVDRLKDGCQLCHQMGNQATREIPDLDDFDSTTEAWDHRVQIGPSGPAMRADSYQSVSDNFITSPYWGDDHPQGGPASPHNPMLDAENRVWMTSTIRPSENPEWCMEGSTHPSAEYFPIGRSGRQISYYDVEAQTFILIDSCYATHHLQFAEDANDTLWFSGDTNVVGWLDTKLYDETADERTAQGWCPTVIDTNGDGKITEWVEPDDRADPNKDMRLNGFA